MCILERHPTTAILPSYRRTSWVRSPRQQHASPHVRGCRDSTLNIQVTGHARGGKFAWPPGRARAARWPWNLHPDSVGRWTTRKPIDAAPRVRFKSTRTQRQRATPTAFGTIGRLGRPATDWWGTDTPRPLQRWYGTGTPRPPAQSAGEAISGPRYGPEGYIADNWLQTRKGVSAPWRAAAPHPKLPGTPGRRVTPETRTLARIMPRLPKGPT